MHFRRRQKEKGWEVAEHYRLGWVGRTPQATRSRRDLTCSKRHLSDFDSGTLRLAESRSLPPPQAVPLLPGLLAMDESRGLFSLKEIVASFISGSSAQLSEWKTIE